MVNSFKMLICLQINITQEYCNIQIDSTIVSSVVFLKNNLVIQNVCFRVFKYACSDHILKLLKLLINCTAEINI